LGAKFHQPDSEQERRIRAKLDRLAALLRGHGPHRLTAFWNHVVARKKPAPPTLSEVIKSTIAEHGLTSYQVAKLAGVNEAQVQRFVKGERGLSLITAEKICTALGLALGPIDPDTE
jgi:type II secretory pathway component PulM